MQKMKMFPMILGLYILVNQVIFTRAGNYISYGPQYKATIGQVWPKPYWQDDGNFYRAVDPNNFHFDVVAQTCDILVQATERYAQIIKESALGYNSAPTTTTTTSAMITTIRVNLTQPCGEIPSLGMDESYYVWGDGRVIANSIWGILRGLETLSQLLVPMPNGLLRVIDTEIYDAPRFKYRGLMLDSARHFIPKAKILQLIRGMEYNKLNTFHWHISDDSAFPYKSKTFPELANKGAYRPEMTYSPEDVSEIVEFARLRGIRVIPEFDTPAHAASWGASHPELLTSCYGEYAGQLGPMNPTKETTFDFLYKFFSEIKTMFKDEYLHLGMDEVASGCWESNPQIQSYLAAKGMDNGDLPYLYLERFTANISGLGWKQMVWQEAMIENSAMEWPKGTIAQVWYNTKSAMATLTKKGYQVIRSADWYLSVVDTGSDWEKFYTVEPTDFTGTTAQKSRVIGGEACLWSEYLNANDVIPITYPRVSAIAERLWSEQPHRDVDEARLRLEEHNCRMIWRGIEARPANSYGLC